MASPYFDSVESYRDVESLNAYNNLQELEKTLDEIIHILQQKPRDNRGSSNVMVK